MLGSGLKRVADEEMTALCPNETCALTSLPLGKQAIGC